MKLLVLDNYDSFTYNLVHLIEKIAPLHLDVYKNDEITLELVKDYDKILLSPGPGLPSESGIMPELLNHYATTKSIFGVCLGFQAIGEHFNSPLKNLSQVYHGIATEIKVLVEQPIFKGCPKQFKVGRYHSWVIDEHKIHNDLQVTACDENNYIMAAQHKTYDVSGVQFHPESILSEYGETILRNWLFQSTKK